MKKEEHSKGEAERSADELAALAAVPRRFTVYSIDPETDKPIEKKLRVAPMSLDICAECSGHIKKIVDALGTSIKLDDIPEMIASHAPQVRAIAAVASGESEDYLGALPLDQFVVVFTVVYEVNQDFFVRRVGPVTKKIWAQMFGDGPTQSHTSPDADTATP